MKIVIQRVKSANVSVSQAIVGSISMGLVVLVGFVEGDTAIDYKKAADKIAHLRIFDDENGVMNRSILDVEGAILSISQFTLAGKTKKGNRPSYANALNPQQARTFYQEFNACLRAYGLKVEEGIFQEEMDVTLVNHGPVTLILNIEKGSVL